MADDSELIGQNEIEALLNQAQNAATSQPSPAASQPAAQAAPSDAGAVGQDEIDSLLNGMGGSAATPAPAVASQAASAMQGGTATATHPGAAGGGGASMRAGPYAARGTHSTAAGDDIQLLLDQAEQAIASVNDPSPTADDAHPFQFRDLVGSPPSSEKATIDLLRDVELDLKIELGRTHMELEELLKLRRGSVVPLDKLAGDPVDVYVNGRMIARGEVLVLNDNFCVRVAELISGED